MHYVVTIDGGGVFGIIPITFLSMVNTLPVQTWAGTSAGSLIASLHANEINDKHLPEIFIKSAEKIFDRSFLNILNPFNLLRNKYDDDNFNHELINIMGENSTIGGINKNLIIPTINFSNQKLKVFDNIKGDDNNKKLWKICRYSSSAPMYFPIMDGYIDGGLAVNNPSIIAQWALFDKLGIRPENVRILSIGAGWTSFNKTKEKKLRKWSKWRFNWAKPIIEGLTHWNIQVAHKGAECTPFNWYSRFNPIELPQKWKLDNLKGMHKVKENYIEQYKDDFIKIWNEFIQEA